MCSQAVPALLWGENEDDCTLLSPPAQHLENLLVEEASQPASTADPRLHD
jgi:hypothetical protein